MPHILVAGKLHPSGIALLEEAEGITYELIEEISEKSYAPLIHKADGLVIRTQPLSAKTIANASNLKIVSRHGVGFDAVDINSLNARNIPLAIIGDINSRSVAEHTFTLLLAASHLLMRYDQACRGKRPWNYRNSLEAKEIYGKSLLICGFGRIGKQMASMGLNFGLKISIFDPYTQVESLPKNITLEKDLLVAIKKADFISFHLPAADKPTLGANEIALLKPNCVILNTSRGGIIDDKALAQALRENRILAAGIDVFEEEPLNPNNVYSDLDNVILTPHSAGMAYESAERMAVASVQNILNFFNEKLDYSLVVNKNDIRL